MAERGDGPIGERAVVVGASMGGLCAARVLAERFGEVVVIDRDSLPDRPHPRRLVPQGQHPHLLMKAGERLLSQWFPGLTDELYDGGAIPVDIAADVHWWDVGGPARRPSSGLVGPSMSRPFLEQVVRRRVGELPNVSILERSGVDGLTIDRGGQRVVGVELDDGSCLHSDLVVDATGRHARSLSWIEALGYDAPPVSQVHIDTRYVSRVYRRGATPERDWKAAAVIGGPETKQQIMCLPMEGDRWIVVLIGFNGVVPPSDDAGMLEMARSFESQAIAEVMAASEPLGPPVTHRFPANQRRHVERLRRVPLGWVLLGDSVCSFDPIYGQGMSSAAQQAEALGRALDRSGTVDRAFARRYFKQVGRIVATPWSIAVGGDFAFDGTTGTKPFGTDLLNRYTRRVIVAGQHDDLAVLRFNEVAAMVRRPESLLAPWFIARVLWASRSTAQPNSRATASSRSSALLTGTTRAPER
jgi:2-polyprenyl-6-methoxyphenol hydroxylase-like FAD-dependent oxidoreductase